MLDNEKLKAELDEDQYAAVTAPLGNMLCIANAGSGKTRVLTYRIAHLIAEGEPEDSFLMLTFTVKAANEMMDRIKKLLGKNYIRIVGGTFHSVAYKFIKRYRRDLGYPKKVTILDETDTKDLLGLAREYYCAFHDIPVKGFPTASDIGKKYSLCRNTGRDFEAYVRQNPLSGKGESGVTATTDQIMGIIAEYEKRKRDLSKMDYDDLLLNFDRLLDIPEAREYVRETFPNVFVDEFQDINVVQASIIQKLTRDTNRLTAVGDDAQCIYGFRGSDVRFIRSFETMFPNAKTYPIRSNYRSSDKIVDLALSVINENTEGSYKVMTPTKVSSVVPTYKFFITEKQQADYIVSEVRKAHRAGIPYEEMAVLVRMNRLPKPIELALTNAKIPVSMDCGVPFFTRVHIRAIVNFIKVLDNPQDELAFWSLAGTTDGIGPKTAQKIFLQFEKKEFDLSSLSTVSVPKKASASFITLSSALLSARAFLDKEVPEEEGGDSQMQKLLDIIVSQWAEAWMKKEFDDGSLKSRREDVHTLREALRDFASVDDFLENVSLAGNDAGKGPDGKVHITTIHRAKGLEWDVVFLPYFSDDILPLSQIPEDIEEERRLCYVALTRGKKRVIMSYVRDIPSMQHFYGETSVFLSCSARERYEYLSA